MITEFMQGFKEVHTAEFMGFVCGIALIAAAIIVFVALIIFLISWAAEKAIK